MSGRIDSLDEQQYSAVEKLIRAADSLLGGLMDEVTVEPESGSTVLWGSVTVSNLQNDVSVSDDRITGTLFYTDSGTLAETWGAGYFLALKFSDSDAAATSVKVGLEPSVSSGYAELDEDMNAVFKVTDKASQILKVISTDGTRKTVQSFGLSGLQLAPAD